MSEFRYFAYGSNMLTERLRDRCPGARPIGVGVVRDREVGFWKRGTDGSAKAALVRRPGSVTHGVLFLVPEVERDSLDRAEGAGYSPVSDLLVVVPSSPLLPGSSGVVPATTYLMNAGWETDRLAPYDWYRDLVLAGAQEHRLPDEQLRRFREVDPVPDPEPTRTARLTALSVLNRHMSLTQRP